MSRVVVKIGTSSLTNEAGVLEPNEPGGHDDTGKLAESREGNGE